jgi:tRNA pseudouridine55 synthase
MIENALDNFCGEIEQVPPMFSALHVKGKRLYELARKGIEIERKPRKVNVKRIEILSFVDGVLSLRIECSSGTYIRSIANDLGIILGCGALIGELRRESIGNFNIENSVSQKDFYNAQLLTEKIIGIDKLNEN